MRNDGDGDGENNYISTGNWMLLILLPSIPVIGWIMVLVLAFTGSNKTRKNYFRALIVWVLLVIVCFVASCIVLAHSPTLLQHVKDWQVNHR